MRVEFNIITTYPNGKKDYCTYGAKEYADQMFEKMTNNNFYRDRGCKISYIKSYWNGSSFHHKEILCEQI